MRKRDDDTSKVLGRLRHLEEQHTIRFERITREVGQRDERPSNDNIRIIGGNDKNDVSCYYCVGAGHFSCACPLP